MKGYSMVNKICTWGFFFYFLGFFKFSVSVPTRPWQRFPLHKSASVLTKEGNQTVCSTTLTIKISSAWQQIPKGTGVLMIFPQSFI